MKTFFLALLLSLSTCLLTQAQTQKGRWTVGTQVGSLSFQTKDPNRSLSASLTPTVGYFVASGLAVGTGVPLSVYTGRISTPNYYNKNSTLSVGLSPFVRYYLGASPLKPFIGISYSYSKISGKQEVNDATGTNSGKTSGYSTALVPSVGLAYFINQWVALSLNVNYNLNYIDQHTDYTTAVGTGYNATTRSLSAGLGFQLFFGK